MARNRTVVRRSFGGRSSPGRLTEWFAATFSTAGIALAANSFVINNTFGAAALAKRPFTITRTVGELVVLSDQNAAVELPFGAVGFQVTSEKAVVTGATAVQDPVTEAAADAWFGYQSFAAEGTLSSNAGRPIQRYPFDFRAQRKVEDGMDLAVVVANASAADGLLFLLNFRMLVKLS